MDERVWDNNCDFGRGTFVLVIGKGLMTWTSNNASPLITAQATVLSTRTHVYGGGGE